MLWSKAGLSRGGGCYLVHLAPSQLTRLSKQRFNFAHFREPQGYVTGIPLPQGCPLGCFEATVIQSLQEVQLRWLDSELTFFPWAGESKGNRWDRQKAFPPRGMEQHSSQGSTHRLGLSVSPPPLCPSFSCSLSTGLHFERSTVLDRDGDGDWLSYQKFTRGPSLAVQWLRPCAPNVGGTGSIPGRGTKTPQTAQCTKKRKAYKVF